MEKFEDERLRVGELTLSATLARRQDHIRDSASMNKYCNPYFFPCEVELPESFCFPKMLMQFILPLSQVSIVRWRSFCWGALLKIIIPSPLKISKCRASMLEISSSRRTKFEGVRRLFLFFFCSQNFARKILLILYSCSESFLVGKIVVIVVPCPAFHTVNLLLCRRSRCQKSFVHDPPGPRAKFFSG